MYRSRYCTPGLISRRTECYLTASMRNVSIRIASTADQTTLHLPLALSQLTSAFRSRFVRSPARRQGHRMGRQVGVAVNRMCNNSQSVARLTLCRYTTELLMDKQLGETIISRRRTKRKESLLDAKNPRFQQASDGAPFLFRMSGLAKWP